MALNKETIQVDIEVGGDKAKKELGNLEEKARNLRTEMKSLKKGSDEYIAKQNELKEVTAKMKALQDQIGITGLTLRQLNEKAKDLRYMRLNLIPGTKAFEDNEKQLAAVIARQDELKMKSKESSESFNQLGKNIHKYYVAAAAAVATVTGAVLGAQKAVESFQDLESSVDNLQSLTGLAGADLEYLTNAAKDLSVSTVEGGVRITTSAQDIVDAYTKVGSARPELLKNKDALNQVTQEALILAEAADMDLEPAVASLAGMMNQFNAPASDARRIINALAAGSKAGAGEIPYLTSVIEKSGTAAADAGLSYETLIGTIETLAPRMTEPERAGTSLRNILLKLQATADDTNPAIVGFETALDNLGKKNLSVTELTKLFGLENITAAKILIDNVAELKNYTQAVTNSGTAIEQAAINTDNSRARMQQQRNEMKLSAIELGEKLAPAYEAGYRGLSLLSQAGVSGVEVLIKYRAALLPLILSIGVYTASIYRAEIAKKAYTLYTTIATAATKGFNTALIQNPITGVISALFLAVAAYKAYSAASSQAKARVKEMYGEISKERAQLIGLFETLRKTREGTAQRGEAVKAINQAYGPYLSNLLHEKSSLVDIRRAQEEATKAIVENIAVKYKSKEQDEITAKAIEARKRAIAQISEVIQPVKGDEGVAYFMENAEYFVDAFEKAGGVMTEGGKKVIDQFNALYMNSSDNENLVILRNFADILKAQKKEEEQLKRLDRFYDSYTKSRLKNMNIASTPSAPKTVEETTDADQDAEKTKKAAEERKKYLLKVQEDLEESRLSLIESGKEREIAIERASLAKKLAEITGNTEQENELRKNLAEVSAQNVREIEAKYASESLKKSLDAEKERWQLIFDAALDGNEEKLRAQLAMLDIDRQKQLAAAEITEREKAAIEEKYRQLKLNAELDFFNKLKEKANSVVADQLQRNENAYQAELLNAEREGRDTYAIKRKYLDDQLAVVRNNTELNYQERLLAEAQLNKEIADLEEERQLKNIERIQQLATAAVDIAKTTADAIFRINEQKRNDETEQQLSALNKQKEKELAVKGLTDAQKAAIEQKYARKEAEIKEKQWKDNQKASETQALINGALAITNILATMPKFDFGIASGIAIASAIATTLAQVATIRAAKMPEFFEGGSTGPGNPKAPAGIVHKEEYVIPQRLLKIPFIRQYVEEIEQVRSGKQGGSGYSKQGYKIPEALMQEPSVKNIVNILDIVKTSSEGVDLRQINSIAEIYNTEIYQRRTVTRNEEMDEEARKYEVMTTMAREYYTTVADYEQKRQIAVKSVESYITTTEQEENISRIRILRDQEVKQLLETKMQMPSVKTPTVSYSMPVSAAQVMPSINYTKAIQDIRNETVNNTNMVNMAALDQAARALQQVSGKMAVLDELNKTLSGGITTKFYHQQYLDFQESINQMIADTSIS